MLPLGQRGAPLPVPAFDNSDSILYSGLANRRLTIAGCDHSAKEARLLYQLQELPFYSAAILTTSERLIALMARQQDDLLFRYRFGLPLPDIVAALNHERLETGMADR